jgi:hypothetical protein
MDDDLAAATTLLSLSLTALAFSGNPSSQPSSGGYRALDDYQNEAKIYI